MSQSNFYKGLSLLVILNILIKPVWIFFVDRQVQNLSGHDNYGSYFSVFSLSIVLGFIADAGITTMMNRQLAMDQPGRVNQLFNYKIVLSVFYMTILVAVCYLSDFQNWKMVFLVGIIQVMNSFVLFFRAVITAAQKFRTDSWISVLDKLLVIVFLLPFLYFFVKPGGNVLYLFLYTQAGSMLVTLCIAGWMAGRSMQNESENGKGSANDVLKLTLPFIILIALMGMHNRLDMFLLERMHDNGPYEAGVYAAAYRLLDAGNMMGYLAASFLLPFASKHLANREMLAPVVVQLRHSLINISLLATVFCFFFAGWIISLLYHTGSENYQQVLRICIAALPAYMMIHIYGSLLTAAGEFRIFIRIVILAALINVSLNALFIPRFGAIACVWTAIVTQYLLAGLCYIYGVKRTKLPWAARPFLLNLAIAVLFSILFYYLSEKQVSMVAVLGIAGIASALIMFVQTKIIGSKA